MKRCEYCGRENDDDTRQCRECGGELSVETVVADVFPPVEKIAPVENEVVAELLEMELTKRNIPHCLISYRDSAFDGLFQLYRGWGHVEAPTQFKDAVLSVLQAIRQSGSEAEQSTPAVPDGAPAA